MFKSSLMISKASLLLNRVSVQSLSNKIIWFSKNVSTIVDEGFVIIGGTKHIPGEVNKLTI